MGILFGTMNQPEAIDVVIVNYNSGDALAHCLETLQDDYSGSLKIWVVDNASADNSIIGLSESTHVKIIKNARNVGFAQACNQGARQGQAPLIAFINPDCFVTAQQLLHLSNELRKVHEAALIGCRVMNDDGSLQAASRRRLPTFWRVVFHLTRLSHWSVFQGININDDGCFDQVKQVEAVNGACVLVKKAAFAKIHGFDEQYPLHFEDLDLFARLQKKKGRILYDSKTEVKHLQGHSKQDSKQIKLWKKQGLIRYFQQHRPRWESKLVKLFLAAK